MTKPNDSKTKKKSTHTRLKSQTVAELGCLVVKTTKTEPKIETHSKKHYEMVQNGHTHYFHNKKGKATANMSKIKTCKKHITVCYEKREKDQSIFS